jgi:hypothetical protein
LRGGCGGSVDGLNRSRGAGGLEWSAARSTSAGPPEIETVRVSAGLAAVAVAVPNCNWPTVRPTPASIENAPAPDGRSVKLATSATPGAPSAAAPPSCQLAVVLQAVLAPPVQL